MLTSIKSICMPTAMAKGLVEIKVTFVLDWCLHRYCAAGAESRTPNLRMLCTAPIETRKIVKNRSFRGGSPAQVPQNVWLTRSSGRAGRAYFAQSGLPAPGLSSPGRSSQG